MTERQLVEHDAADESQPEEVVVTEELVEEVSIDGMCGVY